LYWDGTCSIQCSSPLSPRITAGLRFCDYPCSQPSLSLYWNGSCLPSCGSPLTFRIENNKQYCDFPCSSLSDYLYWNKTCLPSCNQPLVPKIEGYCNFCINKCDPSDFSYWNGSCLPTCPGPLTQQNVGIYSYCNPPCKNKAMFYNEELQTCSSECKQPAYIDNSKGYLRCLSIKNSLLHEGSSSLLNFLLYAPLGPPRTLTIVTLVKPMQYVKYLDINMPPRLQRLAISKGRNVLSLSSGMQMSQDIQNYFIRQALPFAFLKHNLHSSFLVNFWEDLTNILIALAMACAFFILERLSRALDWVIPEIICQTLRVITKWNFCIMALMINIDGIVLFSALEFQSLDLSSNYSGINFAVVLIFLFAIILFIPAFIYLFKKRRKSQTISQDFQVLFNGFRNNSILSQLFFLIYAFRIGIPMLIAVCLETTPIGNTALQILLSFGMLTLLIIKKPFTKRINHYQFLLFESIVLLMNLCMLLLTILSAKNQQTSKFAVLLADFVVIGNDLINLMCLVFLIIKLHIESKLILSFTKKYKIPRSERIALWLQLLYIPLQLSHMGFEEIIVYKISPQDPSDKFRKKKLGKPRPVYERHDELEDISFDQNKQTITVENSNRDSHKKQRLIKSHHLSTYNSQKIQEIDHFERLETFGERPDDHSPFQDLYSPEHNGFRKQSNFLKVIDTQDHSVNQNIDPLDLFYLMREQETTGSPDIQFINNTSQENMTGDHESSFHFSERQKTQNSSKLSIPKRSMQPSLDHNLSFSQSEDIIEFSQSNIQDIAPNHHMFNAQKTRSKEFRVNERAVGQLKQQQRRLKVVEPDEQWRLDLWKNGRKLFTLSQKK